jgi:hypothetical protein
MANLERDTAAPVIAVAGDVASEGTAHDVVSVAAAS